MKSIFRNNALLLTAICMVIERRQSVETVFVGRSATRRQLSPFKLDSFNRGIPVLCDIAFISIVDAAALPAIIKQQSDDDACIRHQGPQSNS